MDKLLKKLQYKKQGKVLIYDAPEMLANGLNNMDISFDTQMVGGAGNYEFVMFFVKELEKANRLAGKIADVMQYDGILWLCYPKGSSKKYKSDINRNKTWDIMSPFGLRPVSQISVDDDWSAVRFRPNEKVNAKK